MNTMNSRKIVERIYICGVLTLETPAHFGNGDADGLTDIPLLSDPLEGLPLLTGASIAGALRNYLREVDLGYGVKENGDGKSRVERLFGHIKEREASVQSWLVVDDALGHATGFELRDGVAIDAKTRTAEDRKKFDTQLLAAGTTFELSFELLLRDDNRDLLDALSLALHGFEEGEIGLGQRKRRGYGQCRASGWRVWRYQVTKPGGQGLIGWLEHDPLKGGTPGSKIMDLLDVSATTVDARKTMTLDILCKLDGSLLIRSGSGVGKVPDIVHLKSKRNRTDVPILSGTSAAGAIRSRASRIANTIGHARANDLIDEMFGRRIKEGEKDKDPTGSRVMVREAVIEKPLMPELVQTRVKIDRFTGGAYSQALFSEQPLFGKDDTRTDLHLTLRNPKPEEVGLLLLVLKDLWTGDLPFGGESSVGRGRLGGVQAKLNYDGKDWIITAKDGKLEFSGKGKPEELQACVSALGGAK